MATEFTDAAKYLMLNALSLSPGQMKLHPSDPGNLGTTGSVIGTPTACTFATATGAGAGCQRLLSTAVDFTGLGSGTSISWCSIWTAAGADFVARAPLTGDNASDASGEFRVAATTAINLGDP